MDQTKSSWNSYRGQILLHPFPDAQLKSGIVYRAIRIEALHTKTRILAGNWPVSNFSLVAFVLATDIFCRLSMFPSIDTFLFLQETVSRNFYSGFFFMWSTSSSGPLIIMVAPFDFFGNSQRYLASKAAPPTSTAPLVIGKIYI